MQITRRVIITAIIGILLLGLIVFAVTKAVNNDSDSAQSTEQTNNDAAAAPQPDSNSTNSSNRAQPQPAPSQTSTTPASGTNQLANTGPGDVYIAAAAVAAVTAIGHQIMSRRRA